MRKSSTKIIYTKNATSDLYDSVAQAVTNIFDVYGKEYDDYVPYRYARATERSWYNFWEPEFKGTLEEFIKTYYTSKDKYCRETRAGERILKIHDLVAEAVNKGLEVHLSIGDHAFIQICLTANQRTSYYYNASLDY